MKPVQIYEYEKVNCTEVGINRQALLRLEQLDKRYIAKGKRSRLFEIGWGWNENNETLKVKNYVGVIQVPGLTLEILPKIDKDKEIPETGTKDKVKEEKENKKQLAQSNLLYMLSFTKKIPFEERELATLKHQNMTLMEALIRLFVNRLMEELRRGVDHSYVYREENLPCIKGKILMSQHIRMNAAHRERFYVGFDEFLDDTPLNCILKATSRRLISVSNNTETQRLLMEATAIFDEVSDIIPDTHHFDRVHLHRNNERFQTLLDFCRMVWQEMSPNPAAGDHSRTFSLLFPMEKLFEEFIARYIYRYADDLGLERKDIYVQSVGHSRHLAAVGKDGKDKRFQLKPDLIINYEWPDEPLLILDTKWKCLKSDEEDRKNGVSQADMYQMYAYAKRYAKCKEVVLLYPETADVTEKTYCLIEDETNCTGIVKEQKKCIRVKTISLKGDLLKEEDRKALIEQLKKKVLDHSEDKNNSS